MAISPTPLVRAPEGLLEEGGSRKALAGFFVSGLLLSFLGAILPVWGYHISSDYETVGKYFLSLNLGMLLALRIGQLLMGSYGVGRMLAIACGTATAALLVLAAVAPPADPVWRMAGLLMLGAAAGLLHAAIFHAISRIYQHSPAATVNLAGISFGLGCLVMALLSSAMFYQYTATILVALLSLIPLGFAIGYSRSQFRPEPMRSAPIDRVVRDLKSPGAILFALLLFFQFGNEWSIAGWLPIFLAQRLGISPSSSLLFLAFYWVALLLGRIVAQAILPRVSHTKLLLSSVMAAMLGCIILSATDNVLGTITGILLVGCGFASIYPLVVEKIGDRFPHYHPGFFNGIFSFAFTGAMLAPWTLGYVASWEGIRYVMLLPMMGSVMVFVILLLLWLEGKLSGWLPSRQLTAQQK